MKIERKRRKENVGKTDILRLRDTQTDEQTETQTDKQTNRQTGRQTHRQIDINVGSQRATSGKID